MAYRCLDLGKGARIMGVELQSPEKKGLSSAIAQAEALEVLVCENVKSVYVQEPFSLPREAHHFKCIVHSRLKVTFAIILEHTPG